MANPVTLTNVQTLEAQVAGPGGATRVIYVTGLAHCNLTVAAQSPAGGTASQQGSFAAHVGPELTVAQFRKAITTVSVASVVAAGSLIGHSFSVTAMDADFDDDEGKVELQFDAQVTVQTPAMPAGNQVVLASVAFQVTILAA
jgi:hypothetical protein